MPNNSNDPAAVEVKSDAVSHVRPGLGWLLFSAAVAVFLGSFILIAFFNLATWYDWPTLREFLSATFDFGFVLAPILALLGVAASSFSIPAPQRATLAASGVDTQRGEHRLGVKFIRDRRDVPDTIFKTILPGVFPLVLLFAIRSARPLERAAEDDLDDETIERVRKL